MGVNFPDVRMIVHYGPPREMEEFVQQIGRAGRDGKTSKAVLLFTGHHLRNCDQTIKDYCSTTSGCLRKLMLADFGNIDYSTITCGHDCCLHCHMDCLCEGEDGCPVTLPDLPEAQATPDSPVQGRKVSKEQRKLLGELLIDFKDKLSFGLISYLNPECTTAFTSSLVKMVLKHSAFIFTKKYIMDNLPVFKRVHAVDILCMFQDVFEDIDSSELDSDVTLSEFEFGHCTLYDLEYGGIYEDLAEEFCSESVSMSSGDEDDEGDL